MICCIAVTADLLYFNSMTSAGFVVPLLLYLLSFAAGAMVYVVVEEVIPEMTSSELNIRDIIRMCDELIEAHGDYMKDYI